MFRNTKESARGRRVDDRHVILCFLCQANNYLIHKDYGFELGHGQRVGIFASRLTLMSADDWGIDCL